MEVLSIKMVNSVTKFLNKIENGLLVHRNEPKIEQKRDRNGNLYWQAYDFTTNKSYTFISENDVRVWIENRYHCV